MNMLCVSHEVFWTVVVCVLIQDSNLFQGASVHNIIGNAPLNSNVWAGIASSTTPVTSPVGVSHMLPHGACLTMPDHDRISAFIHDMCAHALLPHVEKQIQQLHDQVSQTQHLYYSWDLRDFRGLIVFTFYLDLLQISNKKSVSRSLLGATKRWFGTNKPGAPNSTVPANAVM